MARVSVRVRAREYSSSFRCQFKFECWFVSKFVFFCLFFVVVLLVCLCFFWREIFRRDV